MRWSETSPSRSAAKQRQPCGLQHHHLQGPEAAGRGSMRLRSRLRPSPETTTQPSAAAGSKPVQHSQRHGAGRAPRHWPVGCRNPGILRIEGCEPRGLGRERGKNLLRLDQQTTRNGMPKNQRQATSTAVSEGRAKTQPIWPTSDWVPRSGAEPVHLTTRLTACLAPRSP